MNASQLGAYTLYQDGESHRLVVYDSRTFRKVNLVLSRYASDVRLSEGDEALFIVPTSKLPQVAIALGIK